MGGAIGDALGWPVEFMNYDDITQEFGVGGVRDLQLSSSGKAEITDDTQMTLFTAEGILRSVTRLNRRGICHPPAVVYSAYMRCYLRSESSEWLNTGRLKSFMREGLLVIQAYLLLRVGRKEPLRNPLEYYE